MSSGGLLEAIVSEAHITARNKSFPAHADIHVLCNTDEDKNSNRHSEACQRKRETETARNETDSNDEIRADRQAEICAEPCSESGCWHRVWLLSESQR